MENNIIDDDLKLKNKIKAIQFLEDSLMKNHFVDVVFIMKTFELNRKEFEQCFKIAEEKLELR